MALGVLIAIVLGVFWLWMLIDCIKNTKITGTEKVVWIFIVLLFNWLGGLVYYFTIRKGESTGFLNFVGLAFAIIITVSVVIGMMHSIKNTTKEDEKVKSNSNRPDLLKNPFKQCEKPKLQFGNTTEQKDKIENQVNTSKYILLNKRDESKAPDRSLKDIANIDTSKYSDNLKSWVDSEGKIHFKN